MAKSNPVADVMRAAAYKAGCEFGGVFISHGKEFSRVKLWLVSGPVDALVKALKREGLDAYTIPPASWHCSDYARSSVAVRYTAAQAQRIKPVKAPLRRNKLTRAQSANIGVALRELDRCEASARFVSAALAAKVAPHIAEVRKLLRGAKG